MGSSASLGYFVILKNLSWRAGETRNLGGGGEEGALKGTCIPTTSCNDHGLEKFLSIFGCGEGWDEIIEKSDI